MRIVLVVIFLLLPFGAVIASETIEDSQEVVSLYSRGKRLLRQGDWLEAARLFEELSGRFPESNNYDLFLFNRSKAEYYFGNLDKALSGFSRFESRFKNSEFVAHAWFFSGNIYYQKGRPANALEHWLNAYIDCNDYRLEELIVESIRLMIRGADKVNISTDIFSSIPVDQKCKLYDQIVPELKQRNEMMTAQSLLEQCGKTLSVSELARSQERTTNRDLEIAMLLPFSGELQAFGDDIYGGAVVAAEEYRKRTSKTISIVTYDTQGDPVIAARIAKELVNSLTDAIVGPLTSDAAQVVSAASGCGDLPVIAPAATQAGLTRLSETAFQLSPNIELQAVAMADYAVMNLQADSAVIISSTNRDHLLMSRAFATRFADLGGTIIAIEYYRPRDTDFGAYIRDVKSMLLGLPTDSSVFINEEGDTLHIDAVGVDVDCLYMPGNASQLRLMLPQLQFYNIRGKLLGSDGWNDDGLYRLGDHITRLAVFPSPFLQPASSEVFTMFSAAYDARYGKPPARLSALGYDAVKLIIQAASKGGMSRDDLTANLSTIADFQGAAARVTFGRDRENIELPLYRIENGMAVPVGLSGQSEGTVQE